MLQRFSAVQKNIPQSKLYCNFESVLMFPQLKWCCNLLSSVPKLSHTYAVMLQRFSAVQKNIPQSKWYCNFESVLIFPQLKCNFESVLIFPQLKCNFESVLIFPQLKCNFESVLIFPQLKCNFESVLIFPHLCPDVYLFSFHSHCRFSQDATIRSWCFCGSPTWKIHHISIPISQDLSMI